MIIYTKLGDYMSKHKEKLKKLFVHPISGNIDGMRLISALEHYGAEVDISKKGRALIHLKGREDRKSVV